MAADRFVYWNDQAPSLEDVELVLTNFFGEGGATKIEWKGDRFFITLPGRNTFPFNGLSNSRETAETERFAQPFDNRKIEVWVTPDTLDVLTRQQDEYTNCIATGLAQMFARYWSGTLQM